MRLHRIPVLLAAAVLFALAAAPPASAQAPALHPAPAYGTQDRIQHHIAYTEFMPLSSSNSFVIVDTATSSGIGPGGIETFRAHAQLPSGARLFSFELDACDSDPSAHVSGKLVDCDFLGGNCQPLNTIFSTGTGCGFVVADLTPLGFTVDNNQRQLLVEVQLTQPSHRLLGAYVGYKLQVSPAPATATFSDVPTTSPQFRFVEALVAAGITAGCGGGNYCPGQPVTRGQMAVFLASALGLHFPN